MTYDSEELQYIVELLRGLYEDEQIHQLERTFAQTRTESYPMPMTEHPAYVKQAEFVRSLNKEVVKVLKTQRVEFHDTIYPAPTETRTILLRRRRFWSPAPATGDPRLMRSAYLWDAWIDPYGRWIAGDAKLHTEMRF